MQADAGKWMRLMRKHVIPRISAEWDSVSYSLEYSAQATKQFRELYQLVSVIIIVLAWCIGKVQTLDWNSGMDCWTYIFLVSHFFWFELHWLKDPQQWMVEISSVICFVHVPIQM